MNTSNPRVKLIWICLFIILLSFFLQNVFENINDYYQYTVITNIEYVNEYPMTLPAITLCLTSFLPNSTYLTLDKYLYHCSISGARCGYNDFYSFEIRTSFRNASMTCYAVNGGRNSSGHSSEIKSTKTTDFNSGFQLFFFYQKDTCCFTTSMMLM